MAIFEDNGVKLAAAVITLSVVSLIVFPLRVYVRIVNKSWGVDDWLMLIGTIPFLALSAACLGGSVNGVGWHESRLSSEGISRGLMWFFFFEVFWCGSVVPVKLSISFMLARIAGPKRAFVYSLWATSALFTLMNGIALFYIIFQCSPVSYAWDTSTPGGHCNQASMLADIYYATTAVNIATDWFCAVLPIPLLWNLQLDSRSKVSVGFLLGLGVLASLSACIRLRYTVLLTTTEDYLFGLGEVTLWGYAEVAVGFVVGCASTLRPLLNRALKTDSKSTLQKRTDAGNMELPSINLTGPNRGKVTTYVNAGISHVRNSSWSTSEENLVYGLNKGHDGIYVSKSAMQETEDRPEV